MGFQRIALFIGVAALAVAAGLWLQLQLAKPATPPETEATLLQSPRPLGTVVLLDQDGREFPIDRLEGRWNLLFFGFTQCPDVCPTTLAMMGQVSEVLRALPEAARPRMVFVSIDPERDTPDIMRAYVGHFSADFLGLTGDLDQVTALAGQLGVAFQKVPYAQGGYTMDHSAALFLLNPRVEFNAVFSAPHSVEGIAGDYTKIIHYLGEQQ
ncbi:MAG: SCO family protein [Gammaproteobacteria bacterium]|jgi:protein SCO1/2|nr:SCO family protein [Gammaproteobacteria bacterium]